MIGLFTYILNCTGPGGSASDFIQHTVNSIAIVPPPPVRPLNSDLEGIILDPGTGIGLNTVKGKVSDVNELGTSGIGFTDLFEIEASSTDDMNLWEVTHGTNFSDIPVLLPYDSPPLSNIGSYTNFPTVTYNFTPLPSGKYWWVRLCANTDMHDAHLPLEVNFANNCGPWESPPPLVTLSVTPSSVLPDHPATVTWTSTFASKCESTDFRVPGNAVSGTATVSYPDRRRVYTEPLSVTCFGPGGYRTANATLTVLAGESVSCTPNVASADVGASITYTATPSGFYSAPGYAWTATGGMPMSSGEARVSANTFTTEYDTAGDYSAEVDALDVEGDWIRTSCTPVHVGASGGICASPSTSISATPTRLAAPGSTSITWNAANIDNSCTITGTDGYNTTVPSASCSPFGNTITTTVTTQTTYCIVCDANPATRSCTTVNVGGKVRLF